MVPRPLQKLGSDSPLRPQVFTPNYQIINKNKFQPNPPKWNNKLELNTKSDHTCDKQLA